MNPKSHHKPNLQNTSKYGFSPDLGGKNGGVLSMRMQVILDSSFARPGSAPIWGKKGEFRDWTSVSVNFESCSAGTDPKITLAQAHVIQCCLCDLFKNVSL